MTKITAQDARKNFSEVISKAAFGNEKIVVTRQGKNVAAIISYEEYEYYRQLEDLIDGKIASERLQSSNKRYSLEEVKAQLGL